jgi:hypothetical protein
MAYYMVNFCLILPEEKMETCTLLLPSIERNLVSITICGYIKFNDNAVN